MTRALITGGAGFIGSHLTERLVHSGIHVDVVDNLHTGSIKNIDHLLMTHPEQISFIEGDITDINCDCYGDGLPYDYIYNCACPASPVAYQAAPFDTLMTCFQGTYNLLGLAQRYGSVMVHTSTSEIYGDPLVHPQHESYWGNVNTWGPRSCYDEGKRVAEALCYESLKLGVDVRVVRIFNTYGPRMARDDGRVVSNFITQAQDGVDITIYGTGNQTRSFCYVDDMVTGLIHIACLEGGLSAPVNLGNPNEASVNDIAKRVLSLTQSRSKIICMALPVDDPEKRKPDIGKALSLGWSPKVDIETGLTSTIRYFEALKHDIQG